MKNIPLYIISSILLLLSACSSQSPQQDIEETRTLQLIVSQQQLRSFFKDPNQEQVLFRWDEGSTDIQIIFKQGTTLAHIGGVRNEGIDNGNALFTISIPAIIDATKPFDLYGVVAERVRVQENKILVGVDAHSTYDLHFSSPNRDTQAPVFFELKGINANQKTISASFQHLGAMAVISIKNSSNETLHTAGFAITPHGTSSDFYYKGALPYSGNTELPYIDLLNPSPAPTMLLSNVIYPKVEIASGEVAKVGFWFKPLINTSSDIDVVMYQLPDKSIHSTTFLPARTIKPGEAYAIYAEWDGNQLNLLNDEPIAPMPTNLRVAKFQTSLGTGKMISIGIYPTDRASKEYAFVDLNGNQRPDKGEYITEYTESINDNKVLQFPLQSSSFAIYGDLELLQVIKSGVTQVDLSGMTNLRVLDLWENNISTIDLSKNTKLNTVAIQSNQLSNIIFPTESRIHSILLDGNNLKSLDIQNLKYLTEGYLSRNSLDATALNNIYSNLPKATDPSATWKYHLFIKDNPGANIANDQLAKDRGWTIHK